jgi:hypothetical protein
MPSPKKEIANNLAKFLELSKIKERLYHGTTATEKGKGAEALRNLKSSKEGALGSGVYMTPNPKFANEYAKASDLADVYSGYVMPLHAQIRNPLILQGEGDPMVEALMKLGLSESKAEKMVEKAYDQKGYIGKQVQSRAQNLGYDGLAQYRNGDLQEVVAYNPNAVKSAIGNQGDFDIYNPELSKAEGGQINPIKTPREMMMEMSGLVPRFEGGGSAKSKPAPDVMRSALKAIRDFKRMSGRNPSPQEMDELRRAVWESMSSQSKREIKTDPITQARANYTLSSDPNYVASSPVTRGGTSITKNFNPSTSPDPFIYKAQFGRLPKGSWTPLESVDVNEPTIRKNLERSMVTGEADANLAESITPSADYFGRMSSALENYALTSGKSPVIDELKKNFFEKHNRFPDFDETNAMVADYNVLRHQYGQRGSEVVTSRPRSRTGMQEWATEARKEGVPEAYIKHAPTDYPERLKAELSIAKGETPARLVRTEKIEKTPEITDRSVQISYDENGQPFIVQNFRGGGSPLDMQAEMVVAGHDPYYAAQEDTRMLERKKAQQAAERAARMEDKIFKGMRLYQPFSAYSSGTAAKESAQQGRTGEAALHGTNAGAALAAMKKKLFRPAVGVMGAASVPLSASEAYRRFKKGDMPGAVLSGVETAGNALQMIPTPLTQAAGTALGLGAAGIDAFRGTE